LREVLSRVISLGVLTLAGIVREMNETLRRKEEARIYHYHSATGRYPPRRGAADPPSGPDPPLAPAETTPDLLATDPLQ
jgi:hypothetical protein